MQPTTEFIPDMSAVEAEWLAAMLAQRRHRAPLTADQQKSYERLKDRWLTIGTNPPANPARFPDEVERLGLADEVENCLAPLSARCDDLEAAASLSQDDAHLLYQLTEFIRAVGRYDEATDRLLASYRLALEHAERPAAQVPSLEDAIRQQMSPAQLLAHREADPIYRLGFERGRRKGTAEAKAKYERLVGFYAQHAIIVPPLSYQPSPLLARLKKYLGTLLMAGPKLPLPTRQLLFNQSPSSTSPTT